MRSRRQQHRGLQVENSVFSSLFGHFLVAYRPSKTSMRSPSLSVIYAFFQFGRRPILRPRRRSFPRKFAVRILTTVTLNKSSITFRIWSLLAPGRVRNTTWLLFSPAMVPFSVTNGEIIRLSGFIGQLL